MSVAIGACLNPVPTCATYRCHSIPENTCKALTPMFRPHSEKAPAQHRRLMVSKMFASGFMPPDIQRPETREITQAVFVQAIDRGMMSRAESFVFLVAEQALCVFVRNGHVTHLKSNRDLTRNKGEVT